MVQILLLVAPVNDVAALHIFVEPIKPPIIFALGKMTAWTLKTKQQHLDVEPLSGSCLERVDGRAAGCGSRRDSCRESP